MKKQFIYDKLKSKDGSTLLMTVVVFLVIVIILMGSSIIALSNFNKSKTASEFTSSYYVAEAGLNRYLEELQEYVKNNQSSISNDLTQLGTKFASSISPGSESVFYDFGTLMNESSHSEVIMNFLSFENGINSFKIDSTGILGDSKRTLSTIVNISLESSNDKGLGVGLDIPAFISYVPNPTKDDYAFNFDGGGSIEGPYVTNASFKKFGGATVNYSGPMLVGGDFVIRGGFNSKNTIILGGNFSKIDNSGNTNLNALLLVNKDSVIEIAANLGQKLINNLIVPVGYDLNQIKVYENKKTLSESELKKYIPNIITYNPVNFNPYNTSSYTNNIPSKSLITDMFGNEDVYNYDMYFDVNSNHYKILNNISLENVIPSYSMPKLEDLGANGYPWIDITDTLSKSTGISATRSKLTMPNNSTLVLNSNISVEEFEISGGWNISTINVGSKDIEILTEKFTYSNGKLQIIGTGSLTIKVVGKNGIVPDFVFDPVSIVHKETVNGSVIQDPRKLKIFVNKVNAGINGKDVVMSDKGEASETVNAMIISDNLNFTLNRSFHGVIASLNGSSMQLTRSGNSKFKGLAYYPKGKVNIANVYVGSVLSKEIEIENSGGISIDYTGSMSDEMLIDILDFLEDNDLNNPGSVGNSNGSGSSGTSFSFTTTPPREVGD